ncbi:hypothetical protein ACLBWH_11580 [Sphingomonas sp. M6A6_1c]|jgi:hypothetical protein
MNIDVSSDTFKTQLNDAVILLKNFSQSNDLTISAAIAIIMAAASHEGGFDAIITMDQVSTAISLDTKNSFPKSRQQRRWETKHASKRVIGNMLIEQFPEIFTFDPLLFSYPED